MTEWKIIETVPHNTDVLLYYKNGNIASGRVQVRSVDERIYREEKDETPYWRVPEGYIPSHWMPLPEPPK